MARIFGSLDIWDGGTTRRGVGAQQLSCIALVGNAYELLAEQSHLVDWTVFAGPFVKCQPHMLGISVPQWT